MQKWMLIHPDHSETGNAALFSEWKQQSETILWVDIEGVADEADYKLLREMLMLPDAEIKDALRDRHPPRFSGTDDHLFLLLKPLDSESHSLNFNTQQMAIFAGKNFMVTRHTRRSIYLEELWQNPQPEAANYISPYQMVALLAQRMVTRYGTILLGLEERLDVLEDELMEDLDESHMQELVGYNTSLRKMRRILNYHVAVTSQLTRYAKKKALDEWFEEYEDISEQAERFHSLSELYQNVINDLIEGYISLNSHHLNQVMKVLTVVTVVFLPLSLLVGIYGMNFEYIPELKAQNGYFILLSVMAGIVLTLVLIFRRMKWL
jgi:magnesium transporter